MTDSKEKPKEAAASTPEQEKPLKPAGASIAKVDPLLVLALILCSLCWYLVADRYTPSTSQARVSGYVVGVAPKVAGIVTEVLVENNQRVEEGTPLFQIDRSMYEIALSRARSDLENARSQVDAGSAGVEAARAVLSSAQANLVKAQKDTERLERLREEDPGTISLRRLEISQASLEIAESQVLAAEADIQRIIKQKGGDDDATNAILQTAQSAVNKAELDLSNTTVLAETRGVVTNLQADVGQFAGTGSPVLTLISLHDVWIDAAFTENNLGHMEVGQPLEIVFDSLPGKVFTGSVRNIGLGVKTGKPSASGSLPSIDNDRDWLRQAQRFSVQASIDAGHIPEILGQLRLGGQATVIVYTGDRPLLNRLGKLYIRLMSKFSYAY